MSQRASRETPKDTRFFYEDEVSRVSGKGHLQFGMVVENSEVDSDAEAEIEADDPDREPPPKKGFVRVAWHPNGQETIVKETKLDLVDRSLMPGDVVRRFIAGKDTQRGFCREVRVYASCEVIGTNLVIFSVDSKDLEPLEYFCSDVAVSMGPWVGVIKNLRSSVRFKFTDGSVCVIEDTDAEELEDESDRRDEECEFKRYAYYPGQMLSGPLRIFDKGDWTNCSGQLRTLRAKKPNKRMRAVVEECKIHTLYIQWQVKAETADRINDGHDDESSSAPGYVVNGDALKNVRMLDCFAPCTAQIGDRFFYTVKDTDVILPRSAWKKLEKETLTRTSQWSGGVQDKSAAAAAKSPAAGRTNPQVVAGGGSDEKSSVGNCASAAASAAAAAADKDDTASVGSNKSSNAPADTAKKSKKGPSLSTGKALKRKKRRLKRSSAAAVASAVELQPADGGGGGGGGLAPIVSAGDRVVVEVLCTKSDAVVTWQDGSVEANVASHDLYPIQHLDDHEFFCGDFVVRDSSAFTPREYGVVRRVDHAGRTCTVQWCDTYTDRENRRPTFKGSPTEEPVYDLKDHQDFKFRPGTIVIPIVPVSTEPMQNQKPFQGGQVVENNAETGKVDVWWADGARCAVWPQELFKVGEYDSDDGELWDEEDDGGSGGGSGGGGGSDAESWETESEHSIAAEDSAGESEDPATLRPKLAHNIERARVAMTRLEEIFNDDPVMQTRTSMKMLLDIYRDCRELDKLMKTSFFDESNFDGLVVGLRDAATPGTVSDKNHARKDQVNRLFSASAAAPDAPADAADGKTQPVSGDVSERRGGVNRACADAADDDDDDASPSVEADSGHETLDDSVVDRVSSALVSLPSGSAATGGGGGGVWGPQVCARLCSLMRKQLMASHAEATARYGGQTAVFTQEDLRELPGEGTLDLEGLMSEIRAAAKTERTSSAAASAPAASRSSGAAAHVSAHDLSAALYGDDRRRTAAATPATPAHDAVAAAANQQQQTEAAGMPSNVTADQAAQGGDFSMAESTPEEHKFKLGLFQPDEPKNFIKFVRKEIKLLRTNLPKGISVKAFEDRMDLYSVMIKGPANTPYEDGLFFFDFQLPPNYPQGPPAARYIPYCSDRLNPNLYEDGKVCVSLLGTWSGKGTETWTPNSNMLQLLVSIQGLILVGEPYFNEAGYERQKGSQQGHENSRMYNEMVLLKMVASMTRMLAQPPMIFRDEIKDHFQQHADRLLRRLEKWGEISASFHQSSHLPSQSAAAASPTSPPQQQSPPNTLEDSRPDFPLIPASKGFCMSLAKALDGFKEAMKTSPLLQQQQQQL